MIILRHRTHTPHTRFLLEAQRPIPLTAPRLHPLFQYTFRIRRRRRGGGGEGGEGLAVSIVGRLLLLVQSGGEAALVQTRVADRRADGRGGDGRAGKREGGAGCGGSGGGGGVDSGDGEGELGAGGAGKHFDV